MSTLLWLLFAFLYFALFVTLGLMTLRKGHTNSSCANVVSLTAGPVRCGLPAQQLAVELSDPACVEREAVGALMRVRGERLTC